MSGLFGSSSQATTEQRYNALQLQSSSYGSPIPLVYGTNRIAGNLMWYGAFTSTPHTQSAGGKGGGGGGGSTSYTYSAALAFGLCEGPITGVSAIWADKAQQTVSSLGFTLFTGTGGQTPWSYLTTNFSSQADGYDHTAYLAHSSYQLGSTAGLPNLTYEVQGLFKDATLGGDAEPYNIIVDYCTDANHGCGYNYLASLTGANSYQVYCKALGLAISPFEVNQRRAAEFLADILRITNSEHVYSSAGLSKIIPRADSAVTGNTVTYTPQNGAGNAITTPIYTIGDSGFVAGPEEDPVVLAGKPSPDLFNVVRVQFLDRANQYNPAPAEAKDDADIALNGERVAQPISFDAITKMSVASQVAYFEKNKALYYPDEYNFRCLPDYQLLEPMDVIALSSSSPGFPLSNVLCRVVSIEEGDDTTDELIMVVEALPIGPGTNPQYSPENGIGYTPNYTTAPGSVQTPKIFAAPPQLVHSVAGFEVWIAVGGPSASATWGGCNVLMSLDGGTTYAQVGTITAPARYGTLSATFASGSDPDTANALSVTLNNTALTLTGGSVGDADNMRLLALVENEIVSFEYCTLTGAGAYTFTSTGLVGGTKYMRRGKYGSTIASHASGTAFVRLDANIFRLPIDAGIQGQTVNFKFQSFNVWGGGLEAIAGLTPYSYVVPTIVGGVDPTTSGLLSTGSVPPSVPAGTFSYSSNSSSLTLSTGATGWYGTISGTVLSVGSANTASISSTTLTVTVHSGVNITVGQAVIDSTTGTNYGTVTALGTGTGGLGTYTLSASNTVSSTGMQIGVPTQGSITVGSNITGSGVSANTHITSLGTGTGGFGTYGLDISQTVSTPTSMTAQAQIYRSDGTLLTITPSSTTISSLASAKSFKVYPYVVDTGGTTGSVSWATGSAATGASGSPASAWDSGGSAYGASIMYAKGNLPLLGFTASTVSSGSGGGGGGGSGCLHPSTMLDVAGAKYPIGARVPAAELEVGDCLPAPEGGSGRIVSIGRRLCSRWIAISFNGRFLEDLTVTDDHWFYRATGERVRAGDLRLGDLLRGQGDHLIVTSLSLWDMPADLVSIELEAPHLYYLGEGGPLCHNPKP